MSKIAVVGARESKWTRKQKEIAKKSIRIILSSEGTKYAENKLIGFKITGISGLMKKYLKEIEIILVSGHCPKGGVDIWVEEVADSMKIKKEIYAPHVNQWEDSKQKCNICHGTGIKDKGWHQFYSEDGKGEWYHDEEPCDNWGCEEGWQKLNGYRSRNIQIAKACDVLYCIEPKGNPSRGGRWTMNKAKKLGKEIHLVVIE